MRFSTRLIMLCLLSTLMVVSAQPVEKWKLLFSDSKGQHYVDLETVTHPSEDIVVFWSRWDHSNGAVYKFQNKLWRDRRLQFLAGERGGKALLGSKYPSPINPGNLDKIGEAHHKFFFP